MAITRLTLSDFRSYTDAVIAPGLGLNILTGDNGVGKTNVLEAVSLLTPGRGLRGSPLSDMARSTGAGGFAVTASVDDSMIGVGASRDAPDRRQVRIDGVTASATSLSERIAMVWLTPAMDRMFTDAAGERRRFLDRLALAAEPGHAREAARYDAAMRQRTRLLTGDTPPDPAWLDALEAQMAAHGAMIAATRARLVTALSEVSLSASVTAFPEAILQLDGWNAEQDFAPILRSARDGDAAAGRARFGPHRQDLVVTHRAKQQPAARSSTGEQKALLLGIVLAHARLIAERRGTPPVLLLDEVAAHLDPHRRAALFAIIADIGGQSWLTGTEAGLFTEAGLQAHLFAVADGLVQRA
jgi:DNA replication and repair protein RecF